MEATFDGLVMPEQTRIVAPGPDTRTVRFEDGQLVTPPAGWMLLPPGDAGLTRRVKAQGATWTVREKKGRRVFSRGVWAPAERIAAATAALEAERLTDTYQKKRASDKRRRDAKQAEYVGEFGESVLQFLNFAPQYSELASQMAKAITAHATPVGSGTVARTQRIPVEKRASAAVIAWMRHQTTAYDNMKIARVKGERRAVRRALAQQSERLLSAYRRGEEISPTCPLRRALKDAAGNAAAVSPETTKPTIVPAPKVARRSTAAK